MNFVDLFAQMAAAEPTFIAAGIFCVLLLCGFGLPLPEDVVLAFAGYVCHFGVLPVWFCVLIGLGGVLIGDTTLWFIGHRFGDKVLKLRILRSFLPPARLRKVERLYGKYGNRILFAARFSPGIRSGVFLFSGLSGVPYRRFILTDGSAAMISVPTIVVVAYAFGDQIDRVLHALRGVDRYIVLGLVLIVGGHLLYSYFVRRRERRQMEQAAASGEGGPPAEPGAGTPP